MSGPASNSWPEIVERLRAEGAGLFDLNIAKWDGMRRLRAAASAGDATAATVFVTAADALRRIADSPLAEAAQCACCSAALPPRHFAVAIISPATDNPQQSITMALVICSSCDAAPGAIAAAVAAVLNLGLPSVRGDPNGPLLLVEGPETGLAVWVSTGHETWIALGAIGKLQPPAGRRVVVVSDDNPPARDAKQGGAAKALRKALVAWRDAGINLVVATPWEARRQDKSDMADVILASGVEAVRKRIQAALEPGHAVVDRVPLADAEQQVAAAVGAFFARVDGLSEAQAEWDRKAAAAMAGSLPVEDGDMPPLAAPPADADPAPMDADDWADALGTPVQPSEPTTFTHGVRVDVGVGKSHAAREQVGRVLAAMRARGDTRSIVIAVPDHALGEQQAAAWQALPAVQEAGLQVAAWRGRAALDPAAPGYADPDLPDSAKHRMCGDLERVGDVQSVGLSAETAACKRSIKGDDGKRAMVKCPLFDACSYQAQRKVRADLWLVAHSSLFHARPKAVGEVAALVVDEGAWLKGLVGAEGSHIVLTLDELASDDLGALMLASRDRLRDLRKQLVAALDGMVDGPVQRDLLQHFSLTDASAAEGFTLEWSRKLDGLHPGLSRTERRKAMEALAGNRTVARCAMAWTATRALLAPNGPSASGWMAMGVEGTGAGRTRVLRLKGRREIAEGWQAPTLLLDALLPIELVRPFWPDVELVADVKAAMPHQHIHQVTDKAYAKSMLEPLGEEAAKNDPKMAQRRLNRLRDMRAVLVREARQWVPGFVLVVAQKSVKEALLDLGGLPNNLTLAHHNAVAGRDEWRDVAAVVIIGRTMPSPAGVERIAEALTGQAVPALDGWYERADAVREMADGSTVQADADRRPDPIVEAIRWQVAEGQVVQIVGRGRGARRTEANPVHVLALVDVPLPMPLAGTLDAADLEPEPADLMLAEGGIVFENARHAAAAYPDLWPSHKAAGKAMERARSATFPYRSISIRKCRTPRPDEAGLVEVAYQVAGAGQKPAKAKADLLLCPDPAAFLTAKLGTLAWCKVGDDVPPDPPLPPTPDPPDPDPPAPRPPPSEPLGDDEPPPGHPAWDRPPLDDDSEGGNWVPDGWDGDPAPVLDPPWPMPRPAPVLACDVPWLHVEVPAHVAHDGAMVLLCPYCGELHRHGGFGHRLAHCRDPRGRGYVLVPVEFEHVPPWLPRPAPVAELRP